MKTPLDPRHQRRQKTIQALFAFEEQHRAGVTNQKTSGELGEVSKEILALLPEIDKIISESAPEWQTDKINRLDLAVLRLAVYELVFEHTEPPKVIIDEAVELAKEFGGDTSPAFVNGALGKVLSSHQRILQIISDKFGVEVVKLTPEAKLYDDLNVTELEVADLLASLEKELGVPIPAADHFDTVGELVDYIKDQTE